MPCRLLRNLQNKPEKKASKDHKEEDDDEEDERVNKERNERKHEAPQTELEAPSEGPPTKPARPPIEADDRLRVLAYSDSDSDVESHFQRVKDHLLPGHDAEAKAAEEAAAIEEAQAEEERQQEQLKASTSGRALTKIAAVMTGAVEYLARQMTPSVVVKTAALLVLRGANSPVANAADTAALVTGAAGLFAERRARRGAGVSPRVEALQSHAIDFGKAAAIALLVRIVQQAGRQSRGKFRTRRLINRLVSGVNLSALEESISVKEPAKPPETAAEWAAVYSAEMKEMRRMLVECGIDLSAPRWDDTNAELMRFATSCGLRQAETAAARGVAIEKAVQRVMLTVEWTLQRPPMSESKLKRWERLVAWRGSDAGGHPILLVRFGRALQLCHKSGRLETFTDAILAQVAAGVAERLQNGPEGPERIVAIVDFRETGNIEAILRTREISTLAKRVAADLAAHYPGRLERVHYLELPLFARVGLQSVLSTLAQDTRDKVVSASVGDGSLPVTVALLQKRWSCASGLGRAMSEVSLATTEDSMTPRGEILDEEETEEEILNEAAAVLAGMGHEEGGSSAYGSPREELSPSIDAEFLSARGSEYGATGTTSIELEAPAPAAAVVIAAAVPEQLASISGETELEALEDDSFVTVERPEIPHLALPPPADSPAAEDIATNLLPALEEAADSNLRPSESAASASLSGGASEKGSAASAPASHILVATTPSTLSPQSSQGAGSIQGDLESPIEATPPGGGSILPAAPSSAGSTPRWPLAGVNAMLTNLLPSAGTGASQVAAASSDPPSAAHSRTVGGGGVGSHSLRGHFLKAHRVGTLSSENSLGSVGGTPRSFKKKGGLTELPPRPVSARKTPGKSSLRRSEGPRSGSMGQLSSFPLGRQTSVSWAEHLETVREIQSTPTRGGSPGSDSQGPSPSVTPSPAAAGGTPLPPISPEAQAAIAQPAFSGLMMMMFVFSLLQRLLLRL